MRTTVDLPEPLLRNAKKRASQIGVTLSEVVGDALRTHLAARPSASTPDFKLVTVRGHLVDPNLDLNRTSEILLNDEIEHLKKLMHGSKKG